MIHRLLIYAEQDRKRDDPGRDGAGTSRDSGYLYGDIVKKFHPLQTPGPASTTRCIILEIEAEPDEVEDDQTLRRHDLEPGLDDDGKPDPLIAFKRQNFVDLDALIAVGTPTMRSYRGLTVTLEQYNAAKKNTTGSEVGRR